MTIESGTDQARKLPPPGTDQHFDSGRKKPSSKRPTGPLHTPAPHNDPGFGHKGCG